MRNLLFLSRVAFLCNACFLAAWLFRLLPLTIGHVTGTIVVLAVIALLLNALVTAAIAGIWMRRRAIPALFPRWLIIINFLFLIVQLILFFR